MIEASLLHERRRTFPHYTITVKGYPMKPRVIAAQCRTDFKILLTFTNNEQRIIDISPFLSFGVFQKLKNIEIFNQVKIGFGTIQWPCGVDLDPEFVFEKSIPWLKETASTPLISADQIPQISK